MPALPNVPNVVRILLKQTLNEDLDVLNRVYLSFGSGTFSAADALALASTVFTAWGAHMAAVESTDLSLVEVLIEDLTSPSGATGAATGSTPGTIVGSVLSAGAAFVIRKHVQRRYRGGHPRLYFGGMVSAGLHDAQTWDGTFATTFLGGFEAFMTAIISGAPAGHGSWADVNVSYYEGFHNFTFPSGRTRPIPTLRGTPLVDLVTGYNYNPKVGSQRRRNLQSL
jgi:hypothetical protein